MEDIRHLRGSVVTQLCLDYGMIDDAVYFTSGQVLGGMPLKEGDLVNGIAVRDGAQGGWKALRVSHLCRVETLNVMFCLASVWLKRKRPFDISCCNLVFSCSLFPLNAVLKLNKKKRHPL